MASITTGFLSSPIRTIPSALELPQVMLFSVRERLAGYTADQELGNAASLTLPRRQNSIQLAILILTCCSRKKQALFLSQKLWWWAFAQGRTGRAYCPHGLRSPVRDKGS